MTTSEGISDRIALFRSKTDIILSTEDSSKDSSMLTLAITVPLASSESLIEIDTAFELHIQLSSRVRLMSRSILLFSHGFTAPSSGLTIHADLGLHIRDLLRDKSDVISVTPLNITELSWSDIVRTSRLVNVVPELRRLAYESTAASSSESPFVFTLNLLIPELTFEYRPAYAEVLLDGLTRYLSCLFVIFIVGLPIYILVSKSGFVGGENYSVGINGRHAGDSKVGRVY